MSPFKLRPYQDRCVNSTLDKMREHQKLLGVLSTGGGKTVIFSKIAEKVQPVRTLILAHREELLVQAQDKLFKTTGINAELEKAEHRASLDAPVVVASIQTLMRDKRLNRWPKDHFGIVVVDEAHHALADSYQKVLSHFDGHAKIIGVTATPDRGDQRNLGDYFDDVSFEIGLHELINEGYLSSIKVKTIPVQIDLSGARTMAGDFKESDLDEIIIPYLETIVSEMKRAIGDRKTLVFLPLIRTSKMFADLCRKAGLTAEHIDGTSNDRKEILQRFSDGQFQILSNSMLLTEGFDEPSVECVICLRPTKVRSLYCQIVGRGTRIHPGKENLLILDFLWMTEKHSLVRPAHLVAENEEIANEMIEQSIKGASYDDEEDLLEAASNASDAREAKLAEKLAENKHRRSRSIDPVEFALSLHEVGLAEWEPTMAWHREEPTPKQLKILTNMGFDASAVTCKGHAAALLDKVFLRSDLKMATPKQVHWLRKTGHDYPETASFEEASAWLNEQFGRRAS